MIGQENTQPQFQSSKQESSQLKQSNMHWSWKRFIWLLVWIVAMSVLTVLYIQDRTGQSPSWWPWSLTSKSGQEKLKVTPTGVVNSDLDEETPTENLSELTNAEIISSPTVSSAAAAPPNNRQIVITLQPSPIKTRVPTPINFPFLSNTDILVELNDYRAAHKIPALVENQNLCRYAEKRVQDLIAVGGLDNHAGFMKDTESYESLPDSLRSYPGGAIGENLAYQYCKNMTTGDSFVASTPQQLIEWCFDSSTRGHREAQLNPNYTAACVRNGQGYFVVIFGE